MYLKRLELQGFKSFAPRTVLEFNPGITAIVGPNGSGKSNLSDAIRWVLGEQSMRQLRGKKSDDIIFAGGLGRAPMQMAEVSLVLDNSAGWLPSDFTEVTAARRSFRSGESEYLVSGQRVRLRDLLLLLAQARIGHDSYTVIGQGLVDQTLSVRAEERRGLFEDAAGIRQFQAQRSDAEQKLTLTQTNLARLRDILGEIEPRLGPLAEQARRARDYVGAREELRRQVCTWYRWQWSDLEATRARTSAAEETIAARIAMISASLQEDDARLRETKQARDELVAGAAMMRRTRSETLGRVQALERDLAVSQERRASLDRQMADLEGEQSAHESTLAAAHVAIDETAAQLAAADAHSDTIAQELELAERAQHAALQAQEREEATLRAAQRDVIQAQARLGAAQSELGRLQKQLGERNRTLAARQESTAAAQRALDGVHAARMRGQDEFEEARVAVESLIARREALGRESAEGQRDLERERAELADLQRARASLADRLALLAEWQRSLDGYSDGVRVIFQAPAHERPHMVGMLARLIQVEPGYEHAIEGALGAFLGAVVVKSREDARACARWLRERGAGHALLLWPPERPDTSTPRAIEQVGSRAEMKAAFSVVQMPAELQSLLWRLLDGIAIVDDLDAAREVLHPRAGEVAFGSGAVRALINHDGEVLHADEWRRGGAPHASTEEGHSKGNLPAHANGPSTAVLARERELHELPKRIDELDRRIAHSGRQHDLAVAGQAERERQLAETEQQSRVAEAHAQETARQVTALQRDEERALGERQLSVAVAEQLASEIDGLDQEVAATAARLHEHEARQAETLEAAHEAQDTLDELLLANREHQEALARQRTSLAVAKHEAKALGQRQDQLRGHLRELEQQHARRAERMQAVVAQQDEVTQSHASWQEALDDLRGQARQLSIELGEREAALAHTEGTLAQLDRDQALARQELSNAEAEYRRGMVEAQRARDAVDALAGQIREEMIELGEMNEDGTIEDVAALFGHSTSNGDEAPLSEDEDRLKPEDAVRLRRQIDQLRGKLRQLGGYDPDAPQAYEELRTRHEFLSSQVRDMEQGATNLRVIIAELDATMRRQFAETFAAVNLRFQRHFTTLFSGGSARLELTAPRRQVPDEDDEDGEDGGANAPKSPTFGGVEVFVQIPGKRVQDLALLSGGERAMVSAALLFALLETNPPPFCLLDEVDAALDEANVVRFCEILRQLAENTQFLVITHNRVTMTHATAIYGVSMGEDSVSRMLSMRLDEVPVG